MVWHIQLNRPFKCKKWQSVGIPIEAPELYTDIGRSSERSYNIVRPQMNQAGTIIISYLNALIVHCSKMQRRNSSVDKKKRKSHKPRPITESNASTPEKNNKRKIFLTRTKARLYKKKKKKAKESFFFFFFFFLLYITLYSGRRRNESTRAGKSAIH